MDNYIKGKCMEMCSVEERNMRERERLLHILEMVPGTENLKYPKADVNRTVKSFSRSAAGKTLSNENELRPPSVLIKTVSYLLEDVVMEKSVPWHIIYDFVMDRLRAVRQDMVIQNISKAEWISILQPIVNFHAYSSYRLCTEKISNFDPVINKTHFQECLKRLLCLYDDMDELLSRYSNKTGDNDVKCDLMSMYRPHFESLYLVLNLGSETALRRSLGLPHHWRKGTVNMCIKLSLCCLVGNYVRACRIMASLPALLAAVASLYLPELRKKALSVMSVGYSSKNLGFSIKDLVCLLLYNSEDDLVADCEYFGIAVSGGKIIFNKTGDFTKPTVSPSHQNFVENKIQSGDIPSLLLMM